MKKILLFSVFLLISFCSFAQKTWTGAVDATWANAGNWMPVGVPSSTDEVLFNNAASNTVSLAAATSVGQLKVSNNSTLILKSSVTASIDLTIIGAVDTDLIVASGSTLNITSASNVATEQIVQIILPTTVTASISGNMGFSNTGTALIPHRLLATDVNSVVFNSGSVFTADLGFGGNAFGTIKALSITFTDGSRYISKSGGSPLGAPFDSYQTISYFKKGSTYQHDQTAMPVLTNARYGNFEYTDSVANQFFSRYFILDGNLTIKTGGRAGMYHFGVESLQVQLDKAYFSTSNDYKITGDLIIENGGSLTIGAGSNGTRGTTFIVQGNVIVKSGGTLTLGNQLSQPVNLNLLCISGNLEVESGGNLKVNGGSSTNNLFLMGYYTSQIQTITNNSSTGSGNFSKLYLNVRPGIQEYRAKLASNLEVQDLEFYAYGGYLSPLRFLLGDYNLKVTSTITGAFTFQHQIVTDGTGKLIRPVGSTPVFFPVNILTDNTALSKDFVTLTNAGTPDEFSVGVKPYSTAPSYNNPNIYNRIWNISEATVGGSVVTMKLNAQSASTFVPTNVVLGHGNPNGTYDVLPATYVSDGFSGGAVTANNVTTFSPFIIANDVALGVTLTNFSAQLTNKNTVMLNWQTENEKDNSGFEVQRSADAKDWSNIGFVKGKGQSNVSVDYNFEDKGFLSNLTYYRLKQVDFDGKTTYSKVVNVMVKKNNAQFSVYPNPIKSKSATLDLNENLIDGTLIITNTVGAIVKRQTINNKTTTLDLSTLTNGLYIFEVQKGINRYFEKVMIGE